MQQKKTDFFQPKRRTGDGKKLEEKRVNDDEL
jgi:hypothetical protein